MSENNNSDKEWIKELKAGDKVFVRRGFDDSDMNVHIVKRITPKGAVRLNNDELFKNGVCSKGVWQANNYLIKHSEEKMDEIRMVRTRRTHLYKIENVRWGYVKPEVVDVVYVMLSEAGVFDE